MQIKKREAWIDCAKLIAMLAVLTDHMYGYAYGSLSIQFAALFAVSLFVLLSGISAGTAYKRRPDISFSSQFGRFKKMFFQYALAVFIMQTLTNREFRLTLYLDYLLNFSLSSHFYYFVFFFQLMLILPLFLKWYGFCARQKFAFLWHVLTLLGLCVFAFVSMYHSFILPVHGGGKYLLGGTYVVVYYIGILLSGSGVFERTQKQRIIILGVSGVAWLAWWRLLYKGMLPFDTVLINIWGGGFNPPSVNVMVFSLLTLFFLYAAFSLLDEVKSPLMAKLVNAVADGGRYTLYIFLYRLLVRNMLWKLFPALQQYVWTNVLIVLPLMLLLPIWGRKLAMWFCKKIEL